MKSYSRSNVVEGYCCKAVTPAPGPPAPGPPAPGPPPTPGEECEKIYNSVELCINNKQGTPSANENLCYTEYRLAAKSVGSQKCSNNDQLKLYCGGDPNKHSRDGPLNPCDNKCDCSKLFKKGCDWNQGVNVNPATTPYGCDSNNCPPPSGTPSTDWCDASACFPPGGPKSINFVNKTTETLYYIFTYMRY